MGNESTMRDPQDEMPVGECCICGDEIYSGDRVYSVDEGYLIPDEDCVFDYLRENYNIHTIMSCLNIPMVTA